MADYRKMYLHLVDAVARTLDILDSSRAPDQKLFLSHYPTPCWQRVCRPAKPSM